MIARTLKKIDLNDIKIPIFINKKIGFNTIYGGITTLILIILSSLIMFAFGRDLIEKKVPTVTVSQDYIDFPIINKKDIKIAFNAFLIGGFPIQNFSQYLTFSFVIASTGYDKEKPTVFIPVDVKPCRDLDIFEEYEKEGVFKSAIGSSNDYYCINQKHENMTDIEGMYGDGKFKVWTLQLMKCRNSTENNNFCKSNQEIESKLSNFFFHMINTNYYLDSDDLNTPLKSTFNSNLYRISSLNYRMIVSKFRLIDFISDEGLMLSEKLKYSAFQMSTTESDGIYQSNVNEILRFYFTVDKIRNSYLRSYIRLQKVMADVGGFLKFCMLILNYISHKFGFISLLLYIYNYFSKNMYKKLNENNREGSNLYLLKSELKTNNLSNLQNINKDNFILKNKKVVSKGNKKEIDILNKIINKSKNQIIIKEVKASFINIIKYYILCNKCKSRQIKQINAIYKYFASIYSVENIIIMNEKVNYAEKIHNFSEEVIAKAINEKFVNILK